jgi:hypothetical protein
MDRYCSSYRRSAGNAIIGAAVMFAVSASPAIAQDYIQQQMNALNQQMQESDMRLQNLMRQGQMNAEAALHDYVEKNRPELEQKTQAYNQATGQQLTVYQYTDMVAKEEAARRMNAQNPGPSDMFRQQQEMFRRGQEAHFQRQENYKAQNNAWQSQQQAIENNNRAWMDGQDRQQYGHDRFIQQGIQGNQYYRNSETGEVAELPFAGDTGVYTHPDGQEWVSGSMGEFHQVTPDGTLQEMQPYDPPYGEE